LASLYARTINKKSTEYEKFINFLLLKAYNAAKIGIRDKNDKKSYIYRAL